MVKAFLDKHGVPYDTIDVGEDSNAAKKMIEISGQRGVPVIVVDDEIIVGFDSTRLSELFNETAPVEMYDILISRSWSGRTHSRSILFQKNAEYHYYQ